MVNKLSRTSWVVACTLAVLFCLGGAQISFAATIEQPRNTGATPQTVIITEDGDEYYPDGIRFSGTAITYPGAEELAAKYSSYDGSEPALCARSFEKAIWLARYRLATPLTPGGQIGIDGMRFYLSSTLAVPAGLVLDLKICDDYGAVAAEGGSTPAGLDPCTGTILHTETFAFGPTTAGGTFQITVPVGPLVLDDGMGGGADPGDPDITVQWTFRRGIGGPTARGDVGMYFWCGPADVGSAGPTSGGGDGNLTQFLYRDQNDNNLILTSASGGGANDRRNPVAAGNSKWQVHFYNTASPEPLHAALGQDLLQVLPGSSWTLDPGNLFIFPGALDFSDAGDDCTVDSGFLSSDEFADTIPLTGAPLTVDVDGDGVADNLLGANVDHSFFRDSSARIAPGASKGPIGLEIWGLKMASAGPITVTRGGGAVSEEWTLTLSQAEGTQGGGTLTYNRELCSPGSLGGNAGEATFGFTISPKLSLSRVSGGGPCVVNLTNLSTGGITPNISVTGYSCYYDGDTSSLSLATNPEAAFDAVFGTAATYDADDNGLFTEFAAWATTDTKLGVLRGHDGSCDPSTGSLVSGYMSYSQTPLVGDGLQVNLSAALLSGAQGTDSDGDGAPDAADNCPNNANADQGDFDRDGVGDACECDDADGDGICDGDDPCPTDPTNTDPDGDGLCAGDDPCPTDPLNDGDDDGVCDGGDSCLNSSLGLTVSVAGCDSNVANPLFGDGCTLQDLVNNCGVGAANHGAFVSCVAHLTNDLKTQGLLSGREKGRIQRCAAKSNPHPAPSVIRVVGERG